MRGGCLSWAYVTEHKLGFNTRPDPLDRALGAARRGVELDATSQIVYSALAHAHHCRRELGAFRAAAERVLTLNPRETHCVAFMGLLIATAGDWAKGTSVMREVLALNPHHAGWCHLVFVWDHYRKHEYDKAVEAAELINMPGLYKAPAVLAAANAQLGRTEAAEKHVNDLLELVPDYGKWARDDWTKEFVSVELVEHMIEGLEKAGLEITEVEPAPLKLRQPFVGRGAEQQKLVARLDGISRGEGALVLIGGEPGVGKTRLASEILEEGKSRGLLTLTGHAYEEEGAPFISVVEILEEMVRVVPPRDLRRLLGESGSEIARLVPELRRRFSDIPEPVELPPEQRRRYLFNAVLELFERVSRETPMVLLMDDLHWAAESSLLLLEHLAPHLEKLPLLILGTYRDVDLDVQKPFEKTLARLVRQKLAERYAIRRLAEPDVRDLLAALGGSDPPVALVSAIYRETEGNPFFVTEVFQHLSEEGVLFDDDGEWKSGLDVEALDVPEGVRLVIGRRLERLGEETPKVLTLAAVFGRRFEVRVLEAVEGQDSDVVLDALDESIAAGLVTSITVGREARYEFAHELIRQTLLATLSLPRRQRLHLRVANAFEKVYEARADERAADVARHLYQAGTAAEPTKTIHYLRKAAESALAAAASDEALRFLNMSLSLLEDEPGDGTEKADLLSLRGLAHRGLGRLEDTEADLRGALALYEEGQRWDELARIASDLIYLLIFAGRSTDAMQIAERGLERADVDSARCRLLSSLGLAVATGGDMRRGRETFQEAVALARRLEDRRLLGETLRDTLYYYFDVFQSDNLVRAGEEAIALHRELDASWALSNCLAMTRIGWLGSGQFDKIDGSSEELMTLSTRQGDLGAQMAFAMVQALREAARGDLDAYEAFTRRSVDLALAADWPWSPWNLARNAFAHVFRGRAEDAKQLFDKAEPERLRGTVWDGTYDGLKLLAFAYLEEPEAMAVFEASRDRLPKLGEENPGGSLLFLTMAIEALMHLGQRDQAATLYPLTKELVESGAMVLLAPGAPLVEKSVAIGAMAAERWDEAESRFETALSQAEKLSHCLEQPEVRRWYARMLLDRGASGDREKARELLGAALSAYKGLGMPRYVAMVEALS